MLGLMQNQPLLISGLITFAARYHGDTEVVSRTIEGPIHRYTYKDAELRSRQLAAALLKRGIQRGDRVATLAWNGYRHFELYYGVSGLGAVLHTINPRLFPDQISWIANHAQDQWLFFDATFLPLIAQLAPQIKNCKGYVLLSDHVPPSSGIPGLTCYEDWLKDVTPIESWLSFDENTASSLCYTSGTTGNPKGVLFSHRSTVLHAYAAALPDAMSLSAQDTVLPVVPMFHANAWSLAYGCPAVGAKLVLPGKDLDGKSIYDLMEAERVNCAAGVPTVWLALLNHLEATQQRFSSLKRTLIGGSACPPAMIRTFQERYNVSVLHAWGMTEMSPIGTLAALKAKHQNLSFDERLNKVYSKQGRAVYGVEMKIVDDKGQELPWDGKTSGDLLVRGPWIVSSYFCYDGGEILRDGWFPTGDVGTIDADGYLQITDRSKDVIKSGGEWISSIDIENLAVSHPSVQEAACIALPHPKWDERPLLILVLKPNQTITALDMLAFLEGKIAKWWMPNDVVFVTEIPHTATGKIQKVKLREQFRSHVWSTP